MKGPVKAALRRAGVLPVARRFRHRLRATQRTQTANLRALLRPERAPDGLPVPPPRLRALSGSTRLEPFLAGGRRIAGVIEDEVGRAGLSMGEFDAILDFGVGCGRVVRHWHGLERTAVHGSDYNPELVEWCARNLTFGRFALNGLAPPLPYDDASFDFVYAYSVLTHLTEDLQRPWLQELARVLRPTGHLLVTTHGDGFAEARLEGSELDEYRRGRVVVRQAAVVGTNTCAAFHPPSFVRGELAAGFDVLDHAPGVGPRGKRGETPQDVWLLRKS